jgi:protein-S-isoprenylcysteine O-methyltransferase Ste14
MDEQIEKPQKNTLNAETVNAEAEGANKKVQIPVSAEPEEDPRPPRPFLYRFRGIVLAVVAIVALIFWPADLEIVPFLVFVNLFILAVYLRIKARRAIGDHTRGKSLDAPVLVTWGAYGRMRHPLYVSNVGVAVGLVVLHLGINFITIPFVVFLLAFGYYLSKIDDRYLEQRYGDEWKVWSMNTPAFIPREIHVPGPKRSAKEAILADMSTWIWLAVMIGLVLFRKVDFLIWA